MANHFHVNTPLLESVSMTKYVGTTVYLKMENSQPTGSFKIRGIGHLCQQVEPTLTKHQQKQQLYFTFLLFAACGTVQRHCLLLR